MKKLFFYLVIAFCCQSCIFLVGPLAKSQAKKNLTVEKGAIPPDLGMNGTYVVGVLEERESRDKYLKKHIFQLTYC